ncbi:MAG: hypothetical protein AAF399_22690 [Bacteroidota bacterium]
MSDTRIKTQSQTASVKQFNCANCGAALEILSPRAKYIACQYCGSVLDAQSEEHQILNELGSPDRHPPMTFIQLGQIATFEEKAYQVLARTRWRMKYKEYWQEEGESGYSNEVWIYDEWLLMDANRTYFYLVEDKEGYYLSTEIIPEKPTLLPRNLRMSFFHKQPDQIVREYGQAEVIHFEGESNYQIKMRDQIRFATIKDRGIDFTVEWRMVDGGKEIKEIEFFREVPVSRRKVIEAFGNNEAIEELNRKESFWRFVYKTALFTAVAMGLMGMKACFSDGNQMFQQSVEIAELGEENARWTEPMAISEAGLYRMKMEVKSMNQNSEMFLFAYILDQDSLAINTMDGEFYWYTGVEDGERWTESSLSSDRTFRLEQSGTYYLQIYKEKTYSGGGTVSVTIYRDVWLSRYFIMAFVVSLLGMFFARMQFGGKAFAR